MSHIIFTPSAMFSLLLNVLGAVTFHSMLLKNWCLFLSYLTIMAEVISAAQAAPGACCKLHLHRMLLNCCAVWLFSMKSNSYVNLRFHTVGEYQKGWCHCICFNSDAYWSLKWPSSPLLVQQTWGFSPKPTSLSCLCTLAINPEIMLPLGFSIRMTI